MKKNSKVCVVTCYRQPNYVRAVVLRKSVEASGFELIVVKNRYTSILRYPEVAIKLLISRFKNNPDTYLVTFRGYEILPLVLIIGIGKNIIFDEFINLSEWLFYEHKIIPPKSLIAKCFTGLNAWIMNKSDVILADTSCHAKFSSNLTGISREKYRVVPVSADESIFYQHIKKTSLKHKEFKVFFYGSMLPLHGLKYILESAVDLSSYRQIKFVIVGGKNKTRKLVDEHILFGARIEYIDWVPIDKLPALINDSELCLSGPFGDTVQSKQVITGKTYQFIAMGRVVVMGRIDNMSGFEDKVNSLIIDQGSSAKLTESILWAYKNRDKLNGIELKARLLYDNKYSNEATAKVMKKILMNLVFA